VLNAQEPESAIVGASIISVSSQWFAKIRASDMFGTRNFQVPYNDFPFPNERIHFSFLNDIERRVAYAQKGLPPFHLSKICFGRNSPLSPTQQVLSSLAPDIPHLWSRGGIRRGGTFQRQFLSRESLHDIFTHVDVNGGLKEVLGSIDTNKSSATDGYVTDAEVVRRFAADGWRPIEAETEGEVIFRGEGTNSALDAFIAAMLLVGKDLSLEEVIKVVKDGGWDESKHVSHCEFALLCDKFEVEMILETGSHGCFRYPAKTIRDLARVALLSSGGRVGYLPARCTAKGSVRRVVRFAELPG